MPLRPHPPLSHDPFEHSPLLWRKRERPGSISWKGGVPELHVRSEGFRIQRFRSLLEQIRDHRTQVRVQDHHELQVLALNRSQEDRMKRLAVQKPSLIIFPAEIPQAQHWLQSRSALCSPAGAGDQLVGRAAREVEHEGVPISRVPRQPFQTLQDIRVRVARVVNIAVGFFRGVPSSCREVVLDGRAAREVGRRGIVLGVLDLAVEPLELLQVRGVVNHFDEGGRVIVRHRVAQIASAALSAPAASVGRGARRRGIAVALRSVPAVRAAYPYRGLNPVPV